MLLIYQVAILLIESIPTFPFLLALTVNTFSAAFANVVANRMVLSLDMKMRNIRNDYGETNRTMPNLEFATGSFLGHIGAPLTAPGEEMDLDDLDDEADGRSAARGGAVSFEHTVGG